MLAEVYLAVRVVVLRGTILNRTYGTHKICMFRSFYSQYLVLFTMVPRISSSSSSSTGNGRRRRRTGGISNARFLFISFSCFSCRSVTVGCSLCLFSFCLFARLLALLFRLRVRVFLIVALAHHIHRRRTRVGRESEGTRGGLTLFSVFSLCSYCRCMLRSVRIYSSYGVVFFFATASERQGGQGGGAEGEVAVVMRPFDPWGSR